MTAKRWRGYCLFLLTPLREGRLYRWYEKNGCGEISTHAPAGGATEDALDAAHKAIISTHAPAGGATLRTSASVCPSARFLLTPLREGRRSRNRRSSARTVFLLTPLREGRPCRDAGRAAAGPPISTHAPAGGATIPELIKMYSLTQFLLTPLREGRLLRRDCGRTRSPISTHAPAGGATAANNMLRHNEEISTHAPAGGATKSEKRIRRDGLLHFYSRPCGRGDEQSILMQAGLRAYFYSRPCGRGDYGYVDGLTGANCHFYSRPCGRGDLQRPDHDVVQRRISTHAPAGGATSAKNMITTKTRLFLLTPLREGRHYYNA